MRRQVRTASVTIGRDLIFRRYGGIYMVMRGCGTFLAAISVLLIILTVAGCAGSSNELPNFNREVFEDFASKYRSGDLEAGVEDYLKDFIAIRHWQAKDISFTSSGWAEMRNDPLYTTKDPIFSRPDNAFGMGVWYKISTIKQKSGKYIGTLSSIFSAGEQGEIFNAAVVLTKKLIELYGEPETISIDNKEADTESLKALLDAGEPVYFTVRFEKAANVMFLPSLGETILS